MTISQNLEAAQSLFVSDPSKAILKYKQIYTDANGNFHGLQGNDEQGQKVKETCITKLAELYKKQK
jgi:hypothetical protein